MKKCFTLAEVLITLGIIGVVAAITLPTLIANYQKQQTVNQLKKAYTELNQAVRMAENEYGTLETWDFAQFASMSERTNYFAKNYLLPNIKILKSCEPSSKECWSDDIYTIDGKKTTFAGNKTNWNFSFITASGYSVYYWLHGVGNGAWFYVDLNGNKKPNQFGKDIFVFIMSWGNAKASIAGDVCYRYKLGLFPYGVNCESIPITSRDDLINGIRLSNTSGENCTKGANTNTAGLLCGALIMYDNWQILKGYPW